MDGKLMSSHTTEIAQRQNKPLLRGIHHLALNTDDMRRTLERIKDVVESG